MGLYVPNNERVNPNLNVFVNEHIEQPPWSKRVQALTTLFCCYFVYTVSKESPYFYEAMTIVLVSSFLFLIRLRYQDQPPVILHHYVLGRPAQRL